MLTHACCKALLLLGAGNVIRACRGEQDLRKLGRRGNRMPITRSTFLMATLALIGVPFLSGSYSKDTVLATVLAFTWTQHVHVLLWLLPTITVGLTAFYMLRLYFLTFGARHGAREGDENKDREVCELPRAMWVPLMVLAALAICLGWGGPPAPGARPRRRPVRVRGGTGSDRSPRRGTTPVDRQSADGEPECRVRAGSLSVR
ncbi:MAG: hypothetical protein FJ280_15600 [Planctomycetes bacterium]|nr:hypothetical protein [Planctomycetota bacterium]